MVFYIFFNEYILIQIITKIPFRLKHYKTFYYFCTKQHVMTSYCKKKYLLSGTNKNGHINIVRFFFMSGLKLACHTINIHSIPQLQKHKNKNQFLPIKRHEIQCKNPINKKVNKLIFNIDLKSLKKYISKFICKIKSLKSKLALSFKITPYTLHKEPCEINNIRLSAHTHNVFLIIKKLFFSPNFIDFLLKIRLKLIATSLKKSQNKFVSNCHFFTLTGRKYCLSDKVKNNIYKNRQNFNTEYDFDSDAFSTQLNLILGIIHGLGLENYYYNRYQFLIIQSKLT